MAFTESDKKSIRRFIVSEVVAQMKPFADDVKAARDWQLGFWSNGSGKPPGFFQTRMKEDDKRNEKIMDYIHTAQKRQIEEEDRKKQREARWRFWWPILKWAGGGIGTVSLAFVVWIGPKFVSFAGIVYQTWLRDHPVAAQQIKTVGADTNMALPSQKTNRPQDAGSTMLPNH